MNKHVAKRLFWVFFTVFSSHFSTICCAQTPDFYIDLKKGTFNKASVLTPKDSLSVYFPDLTLTQNLTCRPVLSAESDGFYIDSEKQMVVFTHDFQGQYSVQDLMGMDIRLVVALVGKPVHRFIPDIDPLVISYFYPTDYGCYRIDYQLDTRKVVAIALHAKHFLNAERDLCSPNTLPQSLD
ncbi:MAG: hypothetical protein HC817_10415 [Saprospiraceae bacterium]|nr:hypothetical protein [Saprospiraceae bacterium]